MLIRSQNKHSLINLDNVTRLSVGRMYGKDNTDWLIEVDKRPFTECMGQYSTEAKAIKVLDMIQGSYNYCEFIKIAEQGIRKFDFTFQMPLDEEVILSN